LSGHVRRHSAGVQDPGHAQRPTEGPAPLRFREAGRIDVQVRPSPRQTVPWVHQQANRFGIDDRDDA
jgi:hypothetical protein